MTEEKRIWHLLRDLKERYIALSAEERKNEAGVTMLQRLKELSEELKEKESEIAIFYTDWNKYTIPNILPWLRKKKQ